MNEARRHPPSRRRARGPFRSFLGGGAVAASLGLHGVGAALAVLAWPHASPTETFAGRANPGGAVEFELKGQADSEEAAPDKWDAPPTTPRPATPKRAVNAHASRLSPASQQSATSPAATASNAIATVAPTLSSDTASVLALDAPPATVRRFALSAGSVASHASGRGLVLAAATTGAPRHETAGDSDALAEEQVDRPAQVLIRAAAVYPEAARLAEIETDVPLVLTVAADGHVISAAALAHPGYGLEEAAVRAARAYVFRAAERSGHAVAVRMRWVIQFRLR